MGKLLRIFAIYGMGVMVFGCATTSLKPLEKHLERHGQYTMSRPFQDGNGPGYIFTYTKKSNGKTAQRVVLKPENAYKRLNLNPSSASIPDFSEKLTVDFSLAASLLSGITTNQQSLDLTLQRTKDVKISFGKLEIYKADDSELAKDKLSDQAIRILQSYKNRNLLDGVYVIYEAVKTNNMTFDFSGALSAGAQLQINEIIEGLSIDPNLSVSTDGRTSITITSSDYPIGLFIGYKDAHVTDVIPPTSLSVGTSLKLDKTSYETRKKLLD